MENPESLKNKYKDLAGSREVKAAARRERARRSKQYKALNEKGDLEAAGRIEKLGSTPEVLIATYLQRIREVIEREQPENRASAMERLKRRLLKKYVTAYEDIPKSYWTSQEKVLRERGQQGDYDRLSKEEKEKWKKEVSEGVLNDQRSSLEQWIDYLVSSDSSYIPDQLKYWVFRNMTGLSEYDKEKKEFPKRSKGTLKQFPDINHEALGYVIDSMRKKWSGEPIEFEHDIQESERQAFLNALAADDFAALYAWANDLMNPVPEHLLAVTEGEWKTFKKGDHLNLVQSIRGRGTGWCTAGENTAKVQLDGGDFHCYYSNDDDGKATIPRLAIRMKGTSIDEVRGIAHKQNVDPHMADVLKQKLQEFPDAKKYQKKEEDMKKLTEIEQKSKKGEELKSEDLVFLYEIDTPIDGFGYQKDPRIKELLDQRDKKADASLVFECRPDQIAWKKEDIREDTKAYIGPLFDGFFEEAAKSITHVYTAFPEGKIHQEAVTIDPKKSWQEQVDAWKKYPNDWVYSEFESWVSQDTRFPLKPQKKKEEAAVESITHDLVLVSIPRTVSTDEAKKEIARLGLENATTEDLLALGAKCPELQRRYYITALGSPASRGGGRTVVPVLDERDGGRELDLSFTVNQWSDFYRFLARRK